MLTLSPLQKTIPSDAAHYTRGLKRIGISIHLAAILPAAFLACFQFTPFIRHKFCLFHRLNGHVVILLFLLSNAGVYIIIPTAAGASPSTQSALGVLATITTISIVAAYIAIKRKRIDLHRAFMLRTWVYTGVIISLRLIMAAGVAYIGAHQDQAFFDVQNCAHIFDQYALFGILETSRKNPVPYLYPQCTKPNASIPVVVKADPYSVQPEQLSATMNLLFGMSAWIALAIHATGVELYLWLTPDETERLRRVSVEWREGGGSRNAASEVGAEKTDPRDGHERGAEVAEHAHHASVKSPLL